MGKHNRVIEALRESEEPLSIKELSEITDLNPKDVHFVLTCSQHGHEFNEIIYDDCKRYALNKVK